MKSVIFWDFSMVSWFPSFSGDGGALGDHGSASGSLFDSGSVSRFCPTEWEWGWTLICRWEFKGGSQMSGFIQFSGYPLLTHSHIKNSWGPYVSAQKSQRRERLATQRRKPRAESPALASTINEYVESTGTIIYPRIHVHVGSRRQIYELDDSIGGLDPLCPPYLADLAPKLFEIFWYIQQC